MRALGARGANGGYKASLVPARVQAVVPGIYKFDATAFTRRRMLAEFWIVVI